MGERIRGRLSAILVLLAAASLTDCRDPTQITLEVSTDAVCPDVGNTTITVGRLGGVEDKPATTSTDRCRDDGRVGTLVIVPSGDNDEEVTIRVVTGIKKTAEQCVVDGYKGGCIVARRAVRYVPHTPLVVPVQMSIDCLDIPCEATETCFKGSCIPATTSCNDTGTCVPPDPDGGPPVDAGVDAPPDQSEDTAVDAGIDVGPDVSDASDAAEAGDGSVTCPAGKGECDGDLDDPCEADLTQDALHCGTCTRDCFGGTCNAGACTAVPIWTGPTKPTRLAIDQTHVYFVDFDAGNVFKITKAGDQVAQLASGQKSANTIALDATHVYWTDHASGGAVRRVLKSGGTIETVTVADFAIGVTVDSGSAFYALFSGTGSLQKVTATGGTPTPLATGEAWPRELAIVNGYLYWTTLTNNGFLKRVAVSGGTPEILDTALPNSFAIAASPTHVYYTVSGTGKGKGEIRRVDVATLAVSPIATAQDDPRGIAIDVDNAYWTNQGDGTVSRAPITGGVPPVDIATGLNSPLGIAVDATAVYFTDSDNARVMRIAK